MAGRDAGESARERVRELHRRAGRRIAVLDDDPTGSQSVHDVSIVTTFDRAALAEGLAEPGSTCFILTNSRSADRGDARVLNDELARTLFAIGTALDAPIELVSRSDSTLRGHVYLEISTLNAARQSVFGTPFDATLVVPAFLEAGRFTEGDVHFARVDGVPVPVGETEFARDATFGYRSSNLRDFLVEQSGGAILPGQVSSLSLEAIRRGGEHVAELLSEVTPGSYVVVNATTYDDLEQVALGVALAERDGRAFLHRSGPSFVRALSGIEPREPLRGADLHAGGRSGHGLVVVGSHVGLTNAQIDFAVERRDLVRVELDANALADDARRDEVVGETAARVRAALAGGDVLVATSRTLVRGDSPEASLEIARSVSDALVDVVAGVRDAEPAWIVAKGGITAHDVAVRALGIRRAVVRGQLLPGMVSLFVPVDAPETVRDMPYVVFAGNVGDETTLAHVISVLDAGR